jgi:hypothetical protein
LSCRAYSGIIFRAAGIEPLVPRLHVYRVRFDG